MTFLCRKNRLRPELGSRGFTLLEVILVLLILGMFAALVSVNVGRSLTGRTLKNEAVTLKNALRMAREMSLSNRRVAALTVNEDSGNYGITVGDRQHGEPHAIARGLTLTGPSVYFYPKGNCSGGRLEITNEEGNGYVVTVDESTGAAVIERL